VKRRRLGSGEPRFDLDGTLHVLRDNLGKADAFITVAENLIERCWDGSEDEGDDGDNNVIRRRNGVAHLVESAKLAVRVAAYAAEEFANRRRGA
jgi:hypothetical protein